MPIRQSYVICPTMELLHIIGKKWSIPILEELYYSRAELSFNSISNSLRGATQRNLSLSLKELKRVSLIRKLEKSNGNIRHTAYAITDHGRAIVNTINMIKKLGTEWYGINPRCKSFNCANCEFFADEKCTIMPTEEESEIVIHLK